MTKKNEALKKEFSVPIRKADELFVQIDVNQTGFLDVRAARASAVCVRACVPCVRPDGRQRASARLPR